MNIRYYIGLTRLSAVRGKCEERNELFGKQFIVCAIQCPRRGGGAFDEDQPTGRQECAKCVSPNYTTGSQGELTRTMPTKLRIRSVCTTRRFFENVPNASL
jgi:hypothetical protein